jgi:hypothetical protein
MSRTTFVIPDDILQEVRRVVGGGSVSGFVREAVADRLERIKREALAAEMEAGYRAEAEEPSIDPEWGLTETEGW